MLRLSGDNDKKIFCLVSKVDEHYSGAPVSPTAAFYVLDCDEDGLQCLVC
jgi:hypothetical protein